MSNPLADERIAFNAGVLTAFFGAGGACLAANLVDEEGNNAVTVLPIKTAAGYSCSFDLSRLMPGEYAIALNVGGAPVAFGHQIAHHAMLAGRVMSRTSLDASVSPRDLPEPVTSPEALPSDHAIDH